MNKRCNLTLGLVLLVVLSACGKETTPYEEVRPVRTMVVKPEGVVVAASYSGEIRARHESQLGFRLAGQIIERNVELGQSVKVGQQLFKIDGKDVMLQQVAAKSQFDKARTDYERAQQLHEKGFVSQANVDQAKVAFDAAKSQYSLSSNQGGYTVLRAERAGVVTALNAEVGQVVAAGSPIVKLVEDGEREVVVSVPESRVEELRKADQLRVVLWAAPEKQYNGKLREIAPDTDPITRTYAARISVIDPDDVLRLGMTANVLLPNVANQTGAMLPLTAIYDQDGQPKVWVVDVKTQRVSARPVSLAGVRNDVVLVTKGLQMGETVVTAGAHLLHANQLVRLAASQLNRQ
ncbi:efflux RND transporter periplasmic adaptor subunit [Chitinimonas sp. BJB300]|uniref:efflux RND transporter periplasmic adaptor subunit n=1 Tax=Chitinimonas sp. BJB300 TaxID=1559339 RepID=UPI000C0FCE6C|nr:efflux RND transporter periplasmic adaptor subunit [Chitinimonas sp. BJB300]PHV09944.1 efflux transporter periplasmic adaptor subunit [Chitinimonas sp. BJB300]TSJ90889.1 efflux RND transporter periplasmic adaptor subunit [Chitinimonas sp. BJB300]